MIPLQFEEIAGRGSLPATRLDQIELVDLFDTLLEAGHAVQEAAQFVVALAEGYVQ